MQFTGERFVPGHIDDIALEHYHRYYLAAQFVAGKRVLDIASGEGYGSNILAQQACTVTGVDISVEAVTWASKEYAATTNLNFLEGSATAIPLPDNSVDVTVSFETLEHLTEQETMLKELKRVLTPEGLLLISTPNITVYREHDPNNHFHLRELNKADFENLLATHFKQYRLFGQKLVFGSVISGSVPMNTMLTLEGAVLPYPESSMYLIALASDVPLPEIPDSVLEGPITYNAKYRNACEERDTEREWRTKVEGFLHSAEQDLEQERKSFAEEKARTVSHITELKGHIERLQARVGELETRAAQLQGELEGVYASRSWRLTKPLRYAAKFFRKIKS